MTNKSRIYLLLFLLYCQYGVDVMLSICAQHIVCLDISERISIARHSADGSRVVGQQLFGIRLIEWKQEDLKVQD